MNEILYYVYEIIKDNPEIKMNFGDRIYFFEPSENNDTSRAFIILDPLLPYDVELPASNQHQSKSFLFQIDIEAYDYGTVTKTLDLVTELFELNGLFAEPGGMSEYFRDTRRYVISKRFSGIPKIINK